MARSASKKTVTKTTKSVKKTAKKAARHTKKKVEAKAKKAPKIKKLSAAETTDVQSGGEHLGKIQCFNHRKKTICAHLLLAVHKCGVKTIGHGRLATVRIGKKRRCEFYEETTVTA